MVDGEIHTAIVPIIHTPQAEREGWSFILADPDDIQAYLAWLYRREIEQH